MASAVPIVRWLLLAVAVGAVAIGGYLVGSSATDDDAPDSGSAARDPAPAAETAADCSRPSAKEAIAANRAELGIRNVGRGSSQDAEQPSYAIRKLICRDLTGDDADEMVVQLGCCTGSSPTPWQIFRDDEGEWSLELHRDDLVAVLSVQGDEIVEKSPAYSADDASCCPTTFRFGRVAWDGERFAYSSDDAQRDRKIRATTKGVARVGAFDPQSGAPPDAAEVFGPPSFVSPRDELCVNEWADLGLKINFANLGGRDPCGPDGRVGSIEIAGEEAVQAGWETDKGIRVGMPLAEAREIYPDAGRIPGLKGVIVLVERPSLIGESGTTPVLSIRARKDEVSQLGLSVGAAGE